MLFQVDLNADVGPNMIREMIAERLKDEDLREFALSLYHGTREFVTSIDERLSAVAAHWSLTRMAATDRNVLRLGGYELLHTETPPRVVIDESLELAKKFGSEQSAQFVNGILDKLIPEGKRAVPRTEI